MKQEVQLAWVLVGNELHHVREYSHLKLSQRPKSYCPVCKHQVIMRLGKIRIFHAAHKPEDNCAVTQPETALHLNAKLHLADQLRRMVPLSIQHPCQGIPDEGCLYEITHRHSYISGWDDVLVEYPIDQYRPDIVLMRNGEAIGAIEVFVTHSIEPDKEKFLQEYLIPWVEVNAVGVLPSSQNIDGWTADSPLPYRKLNESTLTEKWICPNCQDEINRRQIVYEQNEIAKQYVTTAFRIVDFYDPDHFKFRSIFFAKKRVQNGIITEIRIEDEHDGNVTCSISNPVFPIDVTALSGKFENEIRGYSQGYIVDSHMKWQEQRTGISLQALQNDSVHAQFPKRYFWDDESMDWKLIIGLKYLDWNDYFTNYEQYQRIISQELSRLNQLQIERIEKSKQISNREFFRPRRNEILGDEKILQSVDKDIIIQQSPKPHSSGTITPNQQASRNPKEIHKNDRLAHSNSQPEYECIFCHRITSDYWCSDSRTGTCHCRPCYDEGNY